MIDAPRSWKTRYFTLSIALRIIILISIILAIWKRDWVWVVGTCIGLFISLLPSIIKKDVKLTLPWMFDFLIALVSILHIGGRLLDYYVTIPGYQLMTRFFISVLVAFISLAVIFVLDEHWDGLEMDKYAMAFVTVIFTMAMGVILEFVKWLNITGTYYIRTNHVLMMNLSADTIAGIIVAIVGVSLIKSGKLEEMTDVFGDQVNELIIQRLEDDSNEKY
jgi:hypothetical protein